MYRHRLSIYLMTTSLVLLAVFLFLFLKKSYQDQVAELQKETGYLFVNSIRGIEGKMMEKMIFKSLDGQADTTIHSWVENRKFIGPDTSSIVAFMDDRMEHIASDSSIEITIRSNETKGKVTELKGSLSVMIAMDREHSPLDSIFFKNKMENVLQRLEKDFSATMHDADLPVKYKVVQLKNDTSNCMDILGNGTYTDLVSGEKYGVELSGFNSFVLKKIIPEILFSFGLFSIVSFAFYSVFKNLQTQQRLTELKNDFIQNMTHELKTPIATVGVAIEALQGFNAIKNPERTKEYLDISKNELNRLSLLVDKVLRTSLFEKNEPDLKMESVDLKNLTEGILNSMKIQFEKQHAIVTPIFAGHSFNINGDPLHLSSVLYNLLDNALKYSSENPQINIGLEEKEDSLILKIEDNGIGIPPSFQERVFDKFFRVPSGDLHNVKGHGLGLSYVASVVKKHGGSIHVASQEGNGSVFTIRLPKKEN